MNLLLITLTRLFQTPQACAVQGRTKSSDLGSRFSWLASVALLLAFVPASVFGQTQITITPSTLPSSVVGAGYSQTLTATGGTGTKTFAVTAGSLPPGLTLSSAGVISGQPTTAGSFIFLVTANDTAGGATSIGYTLAVVGPPIVIDPTNVNISAGSATLGGNVTNEGGISVTSRGVVYAPTVVNPNPQLGGAGVISVAAPTTSGTGPFLVNVTGLTQATPYSFKAYATNSAGTSYSAVGNFTTMAITFNTVTLPNALTGSGYAQNFVVTGGTAPYTFATTNGALPPGLALTSSGFVSGTPTTEGVYTFTLTVTDASGATRAQTFSIFVTPAVAITTTVLPDHGLNVPGYDFTIQATGGTGTKTFSVIEGSLPFGLTLNPSGQIFGTPIIAGNFNFTISATDTLGASATRPFSIVIGGVVTINTSTIAEGTANQTNYRQTIAASGGTGFKTFSVAAGNLPAGLNLSPTGVLSGTPTTPGNYTFTLNATDALGASTTRSFSMVINPALTFGTTTLPAAPLGLEYNRTLAVTGGTGAKTFMVSTGSLPSGLTLSPEGVLSGNPSTAGSFDFTVTVTDAAGATASQAYSVVLGGPIAISPATLTNPVINVSGYNATLTSSGGTGSRTFAVTSGSLPTGLSLSPSGVLTGTATVAGTYNFTVTATDSAGATGTRQYTVVVAPPVMVAQTITFPTLSNRIATDAPIPLAATSSSGLPVTYTVTGPATLAGSTLTLTGAAGVVTVTATQAGNTAFNPATSIVQTFTVTPADRLINLSSRVRIAADANRSLIAGFVIGGQQPKRVLLRAIGPALAGFGVTGALVNPRLQVFDSAGRVILENDDWSGTDTSAAFAQVNAFPLLAGSRDAALLTTLQPGAYTMQVTAGTETGIALAEVYDASTNPGGEVQRLVNISTRGNVEAGDGVLIGGFVITGTTPKRVLVRGVGPSLAPFGVANTLADPRVAVFSGSTVIAQNDDWTVPTPVNAQQAAATSAELISAAQSVAAFSLAAGSRDAAVLVTLAPGAYTAQVAGAGTTTGVALVEVYEIP